MRIRNNNFWYVIEESIKGASHKRKNLPNQDSIDWFPKEHKGNVVMLAISDGHGSNKCFRSAIGSKIAVNIAIKIIMSFQEMLFSNNYNLVRIGAFEKIPYEIKNHWSQSILENLKNNELTEDEDLLYQELKVTPYTIYGATIIIVLITNFYIIFWKLGDGDIITVSKDGTVSSPFPKDLEDSIGEETDSLSSENSEDNFLIRIQPVINTNVDLILVSTDGWKKSFETIEGFLKVGKDLIDIIKEKGIKGIENNLSKWLEYASVNGSGDDITSGLIINSKLLK